MRTDAVTRDLYEYEIAYAKYEPPHCPVCGQECEDVYTIGNSDAIAGCDECLNRRNACDFLGVCPQEIA